MVGPRGALVWVATRVLFYVVYASVTFHSRLIKHSHSLFGFVSVRRGLNVKTRAHTHTELNNTSQRWGTQMEKVTKPHRVGKLITTAATTAVEDIHRERVRNPKFMNL